MNSKHQLSVHYLRDRYRSLQNLTAIVLFDRTIPGTNSKAQWTYIASPTAVNTFQFSFSGNVIAEDGYRPNPLFVSDYTRKGQGFTAPSVYGITGDIPTLNIAGFNGLNAIPRQFNNFNRLFNWKDDFSS